MLFRSTFQNLFDTARCSRKKEEINKKQSNMWISQKKTRLHGTCELHYEKRNITRGDLILNPRTPNLFLTKSSPSQKLSLLEDLPEPLKRPLSTVQEPCSFSPQRCASLSFSPWVRSPLKPVRIHEITSHHTSVS